MKADKETHSTQERIRVLLVIASLKIAGAEKMVEKLAINLDKRKFDVTVLVMGTSYNTAIEQALEENDIPIIYLEKKRGFRPSMFLQVYKCALQIKPHIIHTHVSSWIYPVPAACILKKKIIHTIHSQPHLEDPNKIVRMCKNMLYRSKKMIPVAISKQIQAEAGQVYKLPQETFEVIHNPADYELFSQEPKQMHDKTVFVNVARFNAIKNHGFLLESFAKARNENPNIQLILAGDGELLSATKKLGEALGLNNCVYFIGQVDCVHKLLARCDVFILPSLSEALPISLIEAESAGLPVIASKVGGIVDIVKDNGYLVEVNDEEGFVNAMLTLAADKDLRDRMGQASSEIAKQFAADKIARQYEALYLKYGH